MQEKASIPKAVNIVIKRMSGIENGAPFPGRPFSYGEWGVLFISQKPKTHLIAAASELNELLDELRAFSCESVRKKVLNLRGGKLAARSRGASRKGLPS